MALPRHSLLRMTSPRLVAFFTCPNSPHACNQEAPSDPPAAFQHNVFLNIFALRLLCVMKSENLLFQDKT